MKTHTLRLLHWEHWRFSSTSAVCNKINLYMSRVLPGLSKLALQQVYGVTSAQFCPITSRYHATQQPDLLRDGFERGWNNAQHHLSTRFMAMLQIKWHVFVAHFTLALLNVKCIIWMKCHMLIIHRKGKGRKISPAVYSNFSYSSVTRWF